MSLNPPDPVKYPTLPPLSHQSHLGNSARAAWDAAVPTRREKPEAERVRERWGRGGEGGERVAMATVCFC